MPLVPLLLPLLTLPMINRNSFPFFLFFSLLYDKTGSPCSPEIRFLILTKIFHKKKVKSELQQSNELLLTIPHETKTIELCVFIMSHGV